MPLVVMYANAWKDLEETEGVVLVGDHKFYYDTRFLLD